MDSFGAATELQVRDRRYAMYRLAALERHGFGISRLPYSLRILLENLLRNENSSTVSRDDIEALAGWKPGSSERTEIAFQPARVLLQDFTGVPAIVDLAAMRDAMVRLGGDPSKINPLQPVELVIDHSIQADAFGVPEAMRINQRLDYRRNSERYAFLKWGQQAFENFRVAPPNSGICHQVNIEYLARVVFGAEEGSNGGANPLAYPDTLVGTDSHTPMVNGLGVLGWGVGGIEAEAAMLGQPVSMLIPEVIGFKLAGKLREGATATDLVLTVTQMLRKKGVVGRFVEFYGPGIENVPVVDRATIGNMSPEYGSTCAIFPVDHLTLDYLRLTGRPEARIALVEAYMKEQGLFHHSGAPEPVFSDTLELDLSEVEPSIAGPGRPQDRIPLRRAKEAFAASLPSLLPPEPRRSQKGADARTSPEERLHVWGESHSDHVSSMPTVGGAEALDHGSVVIAAITSCTNTSNPSVMLAAGLLAKRAVERGLDRRPWVKTSLAPGSRVVTAYYERAGLTPYLERLGFNLVGYGCTTCIGNSGPLPPEISEEINRRKLVVAAALSGNRNFEGRIHSEVRANYLMSPPLVVAFALAGRITIDLESEPLAHDPQGNPVFLRDLWPSQDEIQRTMREATGSELYRENYHEIFAGDEEWRALEAPSGHIYRWDPNSTYVRSPPFFTEMTRESPAQIPEIEGARVIAVFGDSITTDHISPAGTIQEKISGGRVSRRPRRRAEGLQLVRSAAGQSRGDGARHLRQCAHPQPACARHRGRMHHVSADRRSHLDLRGEPALSAGRRAAPRPRRKGLRVRLQPGLGRQRSLPAGRARGDRRKLRADSPVEPRRHGRAAAPIRGRHLDRKPRPDWAGGVRHHWHHCGSGERFRAVAPPYCPRPPRGRQRDRIRGERPYRNAAGGFVRSSRGDSAIRAAPAPRRTLGTRAGARPKAAPASHTRS